MRAAPKTAELPQHMAETDEWKLWPRKNEAHLLFGARERQITALCRSGKLRAWSCPDGSTRLDPAELREQFGEPGVHQGRDRLPADPAKRKTAQLEDFDHADPLQGLFREVVLMLRETRQEKSDVLKLIVDPMNAVLTTFRETVTELRARTRELEAGWIDVIELRDEQQAAATARQVAIVRQSAEEQRLNELWAVAKDQVLPSVLQKWAGVSLVSFVQGIDPALLDGFLESDLINDDQKTQLKAARAMVRAQTSKPAESTAHNSNGKQAVA